MNRGGEASPVPHARETLCHRMGEGRREGRFMGSTVARHSTERREGRGFQRTLRIACTSMWELTTSRIISIFRVSAGRVLIFRSWTREATL